MKYPNWKGTGNEGRLEALLNSIGEPNAEAVLRDEMEVQFIPKTPTLFDRSAWRRVPRGLRAKVTEPDRGFHLSQPQLNLSELLARLVDCFPTGTEFVREKEFEERVKGLYYKVWKNVQLENVLNGVVLPVCLPKWDGSDYGLALDTVYTDAMAKSYGLSFPDRAFNPYRRGQLEKQVTVIDGSHRKMVELMTKGPVVGILSVSLQGYSVHAQREQMSGFSGFDFVSLGGGFDFATAMVGYPQVLARDFKTPGLDMSAVQWRSSDYSLYLGARDGSANFDRRGDLGYARGYYSGGLLFRG